MATPEVLEVFQRVWIQIFGIPRRFRCDPEGCFRGRLLEDFCADRGIELIHVPAEHHSSTGDVERAVGDLRRKMELFLREVRTSSPKEAAYAMAAAHNTEARVGGFAPIQWAWGRFPNDEDRLPITVNQHVPGHPLQQHLQLRRRAEEFYKDQHYKQKLSRAVNTRAPPSKQFIPGDLVYYRRHKAPRDRPGHEVVDVTRLRVARWFGPGRVLAAETKVHEEGSRRLPSTSVWIISQGRLKKIHADQLRHASEREKLIAEATGTVTLPWTFSSLTELMKKGQYDDLTRKPISNPTRNDLRGRSRSRAREERRALPHAQPPGFAEDSDEELIEDPSYRLLCDPSYMPLSSVPTGPDPEPDRAEFLARRAAHQISERPLHVRKQPSSSSQALYLATEEDLDSCVFGVTIPTPSDEREWRKILKDPKKFTAKSVQKGAEVSWGRLDPTQRKAVAEAKQLEVDQWALSEKIPAERLMRMRWVLTFKGTENEHEVKAKARIVLLGYSDPDLEELMTSAPTLSRRGRQLLLNLGTFKRWTCRKADAKSAFLQGSESQRTRDIYAIPVPELATALQIPVGQAVKLLKAAYGLASAPREWYLDVAHVLEQDCGMSRLRCEPCIWVLRDQGRTIGVIGSHVDDFLIMGDESHPKWLASLEKFRSSFSWSPWEETPFVHCGVGITQTPDFGFKLDHSAYCTELKQVVIDERVPEITEGERSQCKALLGAVQWRAIQTAPQHCAKLRSVSMPWTVRVCAASGSNH